MHLKATELAARRGGRAIFDGVSFQVARGEVLTITGPNGSGKSTLLRLVAGLLTPTSGTIALDPAPEGGRANAVHYLGHLEALKPAFTVEENLSFWRRFYAGAGDIDEAIAAVGLDGLHHLPVGTLSAGQKRRAAIARLLVIARPIWLLDEPATALDTAAEAMLGGLMRRHLDDGGMILAAIHRPLPIPVSRTVALGEVA
ncbi:heme ABC exporter ATP-binding protein CcmA [Bauldia sp.]|uniref:heme ABC exporter ATP-binding protein CcmA n=1 Tax=Bauldia sp. TaxID=2575872 RepID=UPI003BABB9A8